MQVHSRKEGPPGSFGAIFGATNAIEPPQPGGGTVDVEADVADAAAVRSAAAGCDGVLHTAARHAPHAAHFHEREFVATNVTGTQVGIRGSRLRLDKLHPCRLEISQNAVFVQYS